MTTYSMSDRYGSVEEFEAANDEKAGEAAEGLLAEWYEDVDRSRTVWLHATLHRIDQTDEDADEDGWVLIGPITTTLEAVEPDCTDEDGHWYEQGDVWGSGGGVAWSDTCTRCGLVYHCDTWAQDAETGEQGLLEERYTVAEDWTPDDEEEEE